MLSKDFLFIFIEHFRVELISRAYFTYNKNATYGYGGGGEVGRRWGWGGLSAACGVYIKFFARKTRGASGGSSG